MMLKTLWNQTPRLLRRLIIVEGVLFVIVGLVCFLTGFHYGAGLSLAGCLIIVLGFTGSSSASRLNNPAMGSNTMEQQMMRDFRDAKQIARTHGLMNDILLIGVVPVLTGVIVMMLFR